MALKTALAIARARSRHYTANSPRLTSSSTSRSLDRIDEIVPPGVTVNPVDSSVDNPPLEPTARRRSVGGHRPKVATRL
jgi:hypothetical protein